MFNLGAPEVLVIAVLALLVLGPQRLPDAARQIGSFMGEIRKLSSGFQRELKTAFDDETEAAARKRGAAVTRPDAVDDLAAAPPTIGSMPPVDADMPPVVGPSPPPAKRAAPLTKAAAKPAGPVRKAGSVKKAAPAKKAASVKKAAPAKKAATTKKAAPAKKAAAKRTGR